MRHPLDPIRDAGIRKLERETFREWFGFQPSGSQAQASGILLLLSWLF